MNTNIDNDYFNFCRYIHLLIKFVYKYPLFAHVEKTKMFKSFLIEDKKKN